MKNKNSLSRAERRQLKQIEKRGFWGAIVFKSLLMALAATIVAVGLGMFFQFSDYNAWFYTITFSVLIPLLITPYVNYVQMRLILKLQHAEQQARESLRIDPLTGAYTKTAFNDIVASELVNAIYYPVSLLFIDIDDFKVVNDSYGHLAGDETLKGIAAEIQETLRYEDVLARFGGDEFLIYMPRTSAQVAQATILKIQQRIRTVHLTDHEQPLDLSTSIGYFTVDKPGITLDEMLEEADRAMYLDKGKK